ncbi:MAG: amino acid ABC transporter permease [Rubrimonas sp.]|uniref:amino acid ABC transporter permease n=1 Tax=Rubrimonas sp. TaxID=2036015 RepID=UPI002FDE1397
MARSVAYVADRVLPDAPPPSSSIGPVHWLRENLFSTPLNAAMTLLGLGLILWFVPGVIQWAVLHAVWNASSLSECREIITAAHGEGARGACLAVIRERFPQLIYGFYPVEERWRVNVTAMGLIAALVPLLYPDMRNLVRIAAAVVGVKLVWTIWAVASGADDVLSALGPTAIVMAVAGGLAWVFGGPEHRRWWFLYASLFPVIAYFLLWGGILGLEPVTSRQFGGFLLTFVIGVIGIGASLPIGILLALGRQSNLLFIRTLCVGFIEFIRGVPLITLLFVASTLLNYFLPPGTNFDLILRVLIMVTLFASAYMAEVIRGGLAALPKGQYEAADAMGLTYWQSMRLVILPQALKISIPGIVNTFIGLFKDTTLVSVIGLLDPLGLTKPIRADTNWNGIVWELYGFVAVTFFVFCWGMSRYSMQLERRLRAGDRR